MIETDFQALFDTWKEAKASGNAPKAALIVQRIHLNVYTYAKKRFGADEETSSEFYLHFLSKIEPILENYTKKANFDFKVFFCFRMRGAYFNFLKSKGRKLENQIKNSEWDDNLLADSEQTDDTREDSSLVERIKNSLNNLDSKRRLILKLYFGIDLKLGDVRELCAQFGPENGFAICRNYLFKLKGIELKNLERRSKVQEKLANLFYSQKEEAVKDKRRELLLAELNLTKVKSPFSFNTLGSVLGWSRAKTGRAINDALSELKKAMAAETNQKNGGTI